MRVSRSAYYAWVEKKKARVSAEEVEAASRVKECFYENRRRYGSRRIAVKLEMGRFVVQHLMREQGLKAIQPRSFLPKTTDSNHNGLAGPNLLKEKENQPVTWGEAVVGDITCLPLINGQWAYLATFQDKLTRRIIGWAIATHMRTKFVTHAFQMGIRRGLIKREAIIHTDRGSQYVSDDYRKLLARHGLRQSMSAKGNCYDNAQAKSFFSRFKTELVEGGIFNSLEEARSETFSYIEGYYNRVRLHSSIGNVSPIEFENWLRKFDGCPRIDIQIELEHLQNQPVKPQTRNAGEQPVKE